MNTIGLETHSTTFDIALLNARGKLVMHRKIRTSAEELIDVLSSIPEKKELVIEENDKVNGIRLGRLCEGGYYDTHR